MKKISRTIAVKRAYLFSAIYLSLYSPFIAAALNKDVVLLDDDLFPVFYIVAIGLYSSISSFVGISLSDYKIHSSKTIGINEISSWEVFAIIVLTFATFGLSYYRNSIPLWAKILIVATILSFSALFVVIFIFSLKKKEEPTITTIEK